MRIRPDVDTLIHAHNGRLWIMFARYYISQNQGESVPQEVMMSAVISIPQGDWSDRDAFEKDPARYIPALGGDCAVSLVVRGERVRGSVWHAYEYEGRLFLFADADRKAAFKANPTEYASIDLAAAGRCVVTQLDEGREVPGAAEFAAWHEGKLYRFAGPDQRQAFLAAPDKYAEPSGP